MSLRFRHRAGTLRARFGAGRGGALLRRLRLDLPSGLSAVGGRRGLARVVVTAGGRPVARRGLRLRGRTLEVDAGRRGAGTLTLRWMGLRASGSLARRLASARTRRAVRLTFVPQLTDTASRRTALRLRVRPT